MEDKENNNVEIDYKEELNKAITRRKQWEIAMIIQSLFMVIMIIAVIINNPGESSCSDWYTETINKFNSQFEIYIGYHKKGSKAKSLCDLIRNNNLIADGDTSFPVSMNILGTEINAKCVSEINNAKNTIQNTKFYDIIPEYSSNKLIDKITITESND